MSHQTLGSLTRNVTWEKWHMSLDKVFLAASGAKAAAEDSWVCAGPFSHSIQSKWCGNSHQKIQMKNQAAVLEKSWEVVKLLHYALGPSPRAYDLNLNKDKFQNKDKCWVLYLCWGLEVWWPKSTEAEIAKHDIMQINICTTSMTWAHMRYVPRIPGYNVRLWSPQKHPKCPPCVHYVSQTLVSVGISCSLLVSLFEMWTGLYFSYHRNNFLLLALVISALANITKPW